VLARGEARLEQEEQRVALRAALAARIKEVRELDPKLLPAVADRANWVAETLLRLTPALGVVWVAAGSTAGDARSGEGSAGTELDPAVLMRCGRFPEEGASPRTSGGGRSLLSILGDKAAAALEMDAEGEAPLPLPKNSSSVLLHRCGVAGVLAIASERPAAFTAKHERWLSLLAQYLSVSR